MYHVCSNKITVIVIDMNLRGYTDCNDIDRAFWCNIVKYSIIRFRGFDDTIILQNNKIKSE